VSSLGISVVENQLPALILPILLKVLTYSARLGRGSDSGSTYLTLSTKMNESTNKKQICNPKTSTEQPPLLWQMMAQ
jgi:hypothetical protein